MTEPDTLFVGPDEDIQIRRAMFEQDSDSDEAVDHDERPDDEEIADVHIMEEDPKDVIIYCICRQSEYGFMIGCDGGCEDWFHGDCVGIRDEDKDVLEKFVCPNCTKTGSSAIIWMDTVESANAVLRKHPTITSHQGASKPSVIAANHKKHVARSTLRAGNVVRQHKPLRRAPVSREMSAAEEQALAREQAAREQALERKMTRSLPFSWIPGRGIAPLPKGAQNASTSGSGEDSDHDDDTDDVRRGRGVRRDAGAPSMQHASAPSTQPASAQAQVKRRTYVDVEEAPTFVDRLVKSRLEQALFGPWDV